MIYTIGNQKNYDRALCENACPLKVGRQEPSPEELDGYEGGIVFQTEAEARAFIADGSMDRLLPLPGVTWGVYGLLTDWETGTYVTTSGERALLRDTPFVALPIPDARVL